VTLNIYVYIYSRIMRNCTTIRIPSGIVTWSMTPLERFFRPSLLDPASSLSKIGPAGRLSIDARDAEHLASGDVFPVNSSLACRCGGT
jgi:hypothetical protein